LLLVTGLVLSGCAAAMPMLAAGTLQQGSTPTPAANLPTPAGSSSVASGDASRTITVVGQGEALGSPDIAYAEVGVQVMASTVSTATQQAAAQMDAVLSALEAAGIANRDLQTRNYSVSYLPPSQRTGSGVVPIAPGTPTSAGQYQVENTVRVTIRDLASLGPVLDAAVKAGANNIYGISFGVQDTSGLEAQARAKAMADAQARASDLARLGGLTLGGIVSISEVIGSSGRVAVPMAATAATYNAGMPIQTGQLDFTTQLQVIYAMQ
jgi:hypothetical protein